MKDKLVDEVFEVVDVEEKIDFDVAPMSNPDGDCPCVNGICPV